MCDGVDVWKRLVSKRRAMMEKEDEVKSANAKADDMQRHLQFLQSADQAVENEIRAITNRRQCALALSASSSLPLSLSLSFV